MVDDAYDFGRIAAANALSDIYAMGGTPLFALNLIGFPRQLLDRDILPDIVRGAADVAREAHVPIVGGHSVDDPEPKFGMCVIGEVHPDRIIRNSTARVGDRLVLTKAIGTGVVATAIKKGSIASDVVDAAIASMTTLNREASAVMRQFDVSAATDVTGFGLLGHVRSMVRQSGVSARLDAAAVPLLLGALELADQGFVPGGTERNRNDVAPHVQWHATVGVATRTLLFDAQTSGGLLMCVREDQTAALLAALHAKGAAHAVVIGEVIAGDDGHIEIV